MSLKDAFAGMKAAADIPATRTAPNPLPATLQPVPRSSLVGARQVKVAKSVDPDFEPVKIYIRKQTRKLAQRKWEDADGGDFSELVEQLLAKYLGA